MTKSLNVRIDPKFREKLKAHLSENIDNNTIIRLYELIIEDDFYQKTIKNNSKQ